MHRDKGLEILRIKPKKLTALNFKKYGYIIQWEGPENKKENNQFRIVIRDPKATGWRIAYLIVRAQQINFLEQHPFSFESFEPIKGKAVLYVSNKKQPQAIEAFIIDKPIILRRGIWHNVLSCTRQTHIKITENNKVKLIRYKLRQAIGK
ncbi:MAG: ureidoglycolate lyase [Candidatus Omnitrophica bacterium]|nr:ureidoglycolate lyase [Candidatus Omnitrophota bacterium]